MHPYLKLSLYALLPVMVSAALYLLEKKTAFGKWDRKLRQVLIGVIFGGIAVIGTEYGVPVVGVTMNVRDAAPLCAGLIFGAPAGIIAGVIGGVERFFAAYWGAGAYSQIACSVATTFAGFFAAGLRKFMFDNKKPTWYYGLAAGIVTEVLHMLLVFLTHLEDPRQAFSVVQRCAPPMMFFCGVSVMLALIMVTLLAKEPILTINQKAQISQIFQRRLLVVILIAFVVTSWFSYALQKGVSENSAQELMTLTIQDIEADIAQMSDSSLLNVTHELVNALGKMKEAPDMGDLLKLAEEFNVSEINLVDRKGIITRSTNPNFVGFDMSSGEQSAAFMKALIYTGEKEFVQAYGPIASDPSIWRKYAAVATSNAGFLQAGYDAGRFQADVSEQLSFVTRNRHVGETGFVMIFDRFQHLICSSDTQGRTIDAEKFWQEGSCYEAGQTFLTQVDTQNAYCTYQICEGFYIVGVYPAEEAQLSRDLSVFLSVFMEVLIFTALFVFVYILIKGLIVNNIHKVNSSLSRITGGQLDTVVDVRGSEEFASLSDDINSTVDTLKRYISEAEARIDQELEFAKNIQASALPRVFPPYPNRVKDFDIWASMNPAKEVGGDFYDFYLLGEDKLAFLIADVSGKGIPAAMFMMQSKTLLKSFAETGAEVNEVFTHANNELCAHNDAGMFVTAWMGVLDLKTGIVRFANAGHNPPLVRHSADGSFTYLKSRAGLVLAGMEGIPYRGNELQLQPGDTIYLYTDGVTEATDANTQLYGEERLLQFINTMPGVVSAEKLCRAVKADVDAFVGEAPQFDDITMVCLTYQPKEEGENNMKELTIAATVENIETVTNFVDAQLEELDCPMKAEMQINIAIDELFSNIVHYAYHPEVGDATVRVEVVQDPMAVEITFIDGGVPYDPLAKADPDTTLGIEEREAGGLGIFIVKKSMDEITYEYKGGKNILKIRKNI